MPQEMRRVVIVGAGMADLSAARQLATMGVHVTLVDQRNYTTFPPNGVSSAPGCLERRLRGRRARTALD
jgi:NADH dehydrogenase FAD-containing subunit